MNKLYKLTCYLSAIMLTCCTSEVQQEGNGPLPGADDALKREVTLTLKNKLVVSPTETKLAGSTASTATKADTPIATAEENYIRSLDVYVFGSETEDGEYTFQELFYYRDDASLRTESWAKTINLATTGDNTTALLKLSKGLFVKIYCVANCTEPRVVIGESATDLESAYPLTPLIQSAPGQPDNIVTPGVPTETEFLTAHTPWISPKGTTDVVGTVEADILVPPLLMGGSYTTPLDLTDFDNSARTQMSFKLTRPVARFDVVNDAALSKFTITSIAMGQARQSTTFFPIRPMGVGEMDLTELITTTARPFEGEQANTSLQPGAFYCYPSPKEDGGYIILKGTYAVNQTENKEVTYQIPFKPFNEAEGSFLEVAYNHRYTIAITDADPYHLDFTLTVADWTDDGNIDDYIPGSDADASVKVDIATDPDGKVVFDETTNTVTMPVSATSTFDLSASQGLSLTKSYMGTPEDQQYDWLVVSEPVATKAATEGDYKYTFTVDPDYHGTNYPVALLRFKNKATGKSQLMRIAPETTPTVTTGLSYTLAAADDLTTIPSIDITVNCAQGSTISGPEWLTYDKTEDTAASVTYRVSLVPNLDGFPTAVPADQTITIANKTKPDLTTDLTVKFTETTLRTGTEPVNYDVKESSDNSYRVTTAGKTIQVTAYAIFLQPSVTTAYNAGFGKGNNWLPAPVNPAKELSGNRFKYTYDIVIPASEGTDPDYQLHKGTVAIKTPGGEIVKEYTIWRGASNIPYPTTNQEDAEGKSPYYSAVQFANNWWAPINLGASKVSVSPNSDGVAGNGLFYQQGRNRGFEPDGSPADVYTGSNYPTSPQQSMEEPWNGLFIKGVLSNDNSWLLKGSDYKDLWSPNGKKNEGNDPCPEGWRVPTEATITTLINTGQNNATNGNYILTITGTNGINLILPTAGYRNYSDAKYLSSGEIANYWSAQPAMYLKFTGSGLATVSASPDTFAYSIRCVKE